jgi:hypothetical protein
MNRILTSVAAPTAMVALMVGAFACNNGPSRNDNSAEHQKAASARNNDAPDTSKAPGSDDPEASAQQPGMRGASGAVSPNLRSNQVRTRHLMDGTVTAGKIGFTAVTVNVAATSATGSSAAAPTLVGGSLWACTPSGNQDQLMDNAVLNGDGSITITLAAAATAINNFRCIVVKANTQGNY